MATLLEALEEAVTHHRAGRLEKAEPLYRKVLSRDPGNADALHLLGVLSRQAGRAEAAHGYIARAIAAAPVIPLFHHSMGGVLEALGRVEEAAAAYRKALSLKADFPEACVGLGSALCRQQRWEEALGWFDRAAQLNPGWAEPHSNRGGVLLKLGRAEEAEASLRTALKLAPDFPQAHCNLGAALRAQGDPRGALACYDACLRLDPASVEAHVNRAYSLLLLGDFEEGWKEFEWRQRANQAFARSFTQPTWDGSSPAGRTILVYAEEGLGDTLQFIRYAPLLKAAGAKVVVECQPALARLLASVQGIDQLVSQGAPLPEFDAQAPLLSLPRLFGTTPQTIPAGTPYLAADPAATASWRQRLAGGKPKVGLVWAGNPQHKNDAERSLRLEQFAPLGALTGISFYSLQKGPRAAELENAPGGLQLTDLEANNRDMADSAAALMNLDLVISADTSVAHLAGALGKPVWVLASFSADWRWMLGREDSSWYPTARLFRQTSRGDWAGVIERVREALGGQFA